MKLLVTGGSGFIGSALIRHLIAETETYVVNLDKLTYAAPPGALAAVEGHPRYAFERADICDGAALKRIFAEHRPDAVMHLAAESHVDRSIDSPAAFIETNVLGTWRLLEAALDHWRALDGAARESFRFHHVSTDEVFGSLGPEGAFTEETAYRPNSPYSATKASSDHLVRAWHHTFGLPVVTSNCSNNYGPFQFPEKLIPLMTINALLGEPLPVYGSGENRRDWLHVEDHARALWTVLTRGRIGETYNIGGEAERTNLAVVETICDLVDELAPRPEAPPRRELIEFVPDRPGHDLRYAIDPAKVRRELGWRPRESFESGLRRTVAWYLENRAWWQAIRAGRYDGGRLGLGAPAPVETKAPRGAGLLVLGGGGQLGRALARAAGEAGIECRALDHAALDIADRAAVRDALADGPFDLVVNAAAYTAVDKAESEPDLAFVVNAGAPGALAAECAARGLPLLQVSTDYVFDGTKAGPYRETDPPNPLSVYGRSKLAGEKAVRSANPRHVVLRTAWLYAAQGANFLNTMLRLAGERESLAVVDDQRGSPTAAAELAGAILAVHRALGREPWGTFHFCGAGETTWYGFAREIFEQRARLTGTPPPRFAAIATADYPTPARRPANSALDCVRFVETFGHAPRPWRDALSDVLAERLVADRARHGSPPHPAGASPRPPLSPGPGGEGCEGSARARPAGSEPYPKLGEGEMPARKPKSGPRP